MLLGWGCISPRDLPTPAQGSFFCYLSLPSVQEAGMPWGAECFCLLMAYLKGPERKEKQKCTSGMFPPTPPTGRFFGMRGKNQHTAPWFITASGMGASGRRPLGPEGLLSQSIKHSLHGRGISEMGAGLSNLHCDSSKEPSPALQLSPPSSVLQHSRLQLGFNHVLVITGLQPR